MNESIDDNYNYNIKSTITQGGASMTMPKQAKGGTFSSADVPLIKRALDHYLRLDISNSEVNQIANLIHRLGRIS